MLINTSIHTPDAKASLRFNPIFWGLALTILLLSSTASNTWAEESLPAGHQIDFSYQAMQPLENDVLKVRFAAIAEGESSADVSLQINRAMQQAKKIINHAQLKSVQTGHYRVNPVYGKNRVISHWRGQQTLTISASTATQLDATLSQLQQHLAFQTMQFTLSPEKRQQAQAALLKTALKDYQAKAQKIAQSFGHQTYRLLKTQINPRFNAPVVRYSAPIAREAKAVSSAPYQEQGKSDVQIQIQGTLLLSP